MTELSDNDWKEIYLSDLYQGMNHRNFQGQEEQYSQREFDVINDMLTKLHEENSRLSD